MEYFVDMCYNLLKLQRRYSVLSGDDITNKFALVNVEVPDSVDNAVKNLTDKPTANVGQTFADCWFLVFGGISQAAAKRKLKYNYALDQFEDGLKNKISKIPEEKRIEPDIQKVCPALENAKYCIESEELRNMFSNLISNSMNIDTADLVHPSFGEIIKQMSPLDANVFNFIIKRHANPIMNVSKQLTTNGSNPLCKYLSLIPFASHGAICNALENLCRLNLIDIPYGKNYTSDVHYQSIRETANYINLVETPQKIQGFQIEEEKLHIEKTTFGLTFAKVCMG
jgi:hypothetical protein